MKRSVTVGVRAERRVRRHVREPRRLHAAGPIEHQLRAADVHVEELAGRPLRVDHGRRVEHRCVADAVEEAVDGGRIAHVTDDRLDLRTDDVEQRGRVGIVDEAPDACALGLRARARGRGSAPTIPRRPVTTVVAGRRDPAAAPRPFVTTKRRTLPPDAGTTRLACAGARRPSGTPARDRGGRVRTCRAGTRGNSERGRELLALGIVALGVPHPAPWSAARAGPADGRGLHARLPGAGAEGRHPQQGLPPPLRTGEPLGARGRVQGVRRVAADRALLRPRAADGGRVRHLRARPRVGAPARGRVRAPLGPHPRAVRSHRARVGRRRRPRAPRAHLRSRRAAAHRRTPARGVGRCSPGCCWASRCCSVPISCSRSGSRRSRWCAGAGRTRTRWLFAGALVGVSPYVVHVADRRTRATSSTG